MGVYAKFKHEGQTIEVLEEDLICPLTKQLLVDPVIASDGHTYSRKALLEAVAAALAANTPFLSPVTGETISTVDGFTKVIRTNRVISTILASRWQAGQPLRETTREDFLCPMLHTLMLDPQTHNDERTYSSAAIGQMTVAALPIDRQPLNLAYPNLLLEKIALRFMYTKGILLGIEEPMHLQVTEAIFAGNIDALELLTKENAGLLTAALHKKGYQMAHVAAFAGQIPVLDWLVSKGVVLKNCITENGSTPLHTAAMKDRVDVIEYLHKMQVDPTIANAAGWLAVHFGAARSLATTRKLLELAPDTVNAKTTNGTAPLLMAAESNAIAVLELLARNADCTAADEDENSVLHIISSGKPVLSMIEYLEIILRCPAIKSKKNKLGFTPLQRAVINKNTNFVAAWLQTNVNLQLDELDQKGATALVAACLNKLPGIAHMLLEAGADPNIETENGFSAMFFAILQNEADLVEDLAAHKATIFTLNKNQETLFDVVIKMRGAREILDFLLNREVLDSTGANPLHMIAASKIMRENREAMANIIRLMLPKIPVAKYLNQPDANGNTPIVYAFSTGNLTFAKHLLSIGAQLPSKQQLEKIQLLLIAANTGDEELARVCLASGCNLAEKIADGTTALFLAAQNYHAGVCKLLLQAEAKMLVEQGLAGVALPADYCQLLDIPNDEGITPRAIIGAYVDSDIVELLSLDFLALARVAAERAAIETRAGADASAAMVAAGAGSAVAVPVAEATEPTAPADNGIAPLRDTPASQYAAGAAAPAAITYLRDARFQRYAAPTAAPAADDADTHAASNGDGTGVAVEEAKIVGKMPAQRKYS